jgi:hypothetical protein
MKAQPESLSQDYRLGDLVKKPAPVPQPEPVKSKPWLFKAPDGKLSTALPDPPPKPLVFHPIGDGGDTVVYTSGFSEPLRYEQTIEAHIHKENRQYSKLADLADVTWTYATRTRV